MSAALSCTWNPSGPAPTRPNPALVYTANIAATGSTPTTPQATSDGYLREALKALKKVELHISISSVNAQQGRALAAVQKAIKELETALELKP